MTFIVETGAGIAGANSYVSTSTIDIYWKSRPHMAYSAAWAAAATSIKQGAAVEATDYLDATFGQYYRGNRMGNIQGRLFPRSNATDNSGFLIEGIPDELIRAACELAGRAISAQLSSDDARGGMIKRKREKLEGLEEETEYADFAPTETRYGVIDKMLAEILDGTQPSAVKPSWEWR